MANTSGKSVNLSLKWVFGCLICVVAATMALPVRKQEVASGRKYGDKWSDCGQGSTELSLINLTTTPNPVQVGKDFTLNFTVHNAQASITEATFTTDVYLVGVLVYSETDKLCSHHSCPLSPGNSSITFTTHLPDFAPPGWYELVIKGTDQDGNPSMCADIHFTIYPW